MNLFKRTKHLSESGVTHLLLPFAMIALVAIIGGYIYMNGGSAATTTGADYLESGLSGKCIDIPYASTKNGVSVQLYTCNSNSQQKWTKTTTSTTSGGTSGGSGTTSSTTPEAGASYAGSLVLNDTGAELAAWNTTSSYCTQESWETPTGTVAADSSGDLDLKVTGTSGSCVSIQSPKQYSSDVIEADIDFPAYDGSKTTIADWTSLWLVGTDWPNDGELDATEAEPVSGVDATSWHSGTTSAEFTASTDGYFSTTLPKDTTNLTPGWHVVDIVYTKGFMEVYYDGKEWTQYTSTNVTGDPLNLIMSTSATSDVSAVTSVIGGAPKNTATTATTVAIKYLKIWAYK
jgi:hypothetical protein